MSNYPWLQSTLEQLIEDAESNRLAHALLLSAAPGAGVSEFAGEIASFRLCSNAQIDQTAQVRIGACGQCKSCELVKSGSHPDLIILEPEGAADIIKVDQVRALVEQMSKTPQIGDWKVALLRPAHRLNANAANALLKVLEEPAGQSLLILATERPQILLPTVRSRCTQIRLPSPSMEQAKTYLQALGIDSALASEALTELGPKPLMIADWAGSDLMASWKSILSEIRELEGGRSNVVKAAMAAKNLDFGLLLNWLVDYAARKMKDAVKDGATDSCNIDLQRFRSYEPVYAALLDAKRTLDSGANPNSQLTLESIFLDWPRSTS